MSKNSIIISLKVIWQQHRIFFPLSLLAGYLASYAIWTDPAGNIVTALPTGWGDMIVHLRAAIFYGEQGGLPHESFLLSNEAVGYAWPADFISTLLLHLNVPLTLSFALPTILLTASFIFGLQYLTWRLTTSRLTAIISTVLFIGFSGLSGFYTLPELLNSSDPTWTEALRTLPHHVTAWHEENMVILNPFVMMLHQRGYLLGFPLLLTAIYFAWQWLTTQEKKYLLALTIVTTLLAITHPFTWAAWLLIFPTWMLLLATTKTIKYASHHWHSAVGSLTLAAGAGYLIVTLLQPNANSTLAWSPGWLAPDATWPLFWLKNIGLYVLLIPVAIHQLWHTNRLLATGILASLAPFIAANLFQFAPWDWDNTKLFAPTWLFFTLGAGALLSHWWHLSSLPARRTIIALSLVAFTFSGTLEILRVVSHSPEPLTITSAADQELGESIRAQIPSDAVILTAPNPPNHPVFLHAGRPSLLAYEGWLWSQGWKGTYEPRLSAARTILKGTPQSHHLINQYNIDFVVIGPPEKAFNANQLWFDENYQTILNMNNYTLYDVRTTSLNQFQ